MPVFRTVDTTLIQHDGMPVEVLSEVEPATFDFQEVGQMFNVKTADGAEFQAFADELERADS